MTICIITIVYCKDCKKEVKFMGKSKEDSHNRMILHMYDHDYPPWRQPSSMKKDMPYEEYKKIMEDIL